MKLLLICYECSPYVGSEWAVGWGRLLGAALVGETHVITSEANFKHLERARAEGLLPEAVHFHTPAPDSKLRALEQTPGTFAYNYKAYNYWHRLALGLMKDLHAAVGFDLVHQVNVCTFREPGYGLELGLPFIWGPMGGSQNFPMRFLPMLPLKEAAKEAARGLANRLTLRKGRVRSSARRANLVLGANSTNQQDFSRAFGREVGLLLETGLHAVQSPDRTRFHERVARHRLGLEPEPLRLLWSGELHTRKALPVLLRALARVRPDLRWQLDVLGAGSMQETWQREAARLQLGGRVRFLGRQSFTDAVAEMQTADVLCFTSLRDTSGNVVLESLAAGVPVICFRHQGAGDMIDDGCGVLVEVGSPRQAYADWARALERLADDPAHLLELSYGATRRARKFLWSHNHERVNQMYRDLVTEHRRSLGLADVDLEAGSPEAANWPVHAAAAATASHAAPALGTAEVARR